jgi:hypothetical protein
VALTPSKTTDKTSGDKSDDVFMREVDDAVRRSDMEAFGKRYGWWILGLIVLGLAAFGGYIIWHNQQAAADGKIAERYVTAMDAAAASDAATADPILTDLAQNSNDGYRAAALMTQANIALRQNKTADAIKGYDKVIQDDGLPQAFRDLALVRQTSLQFDAITPEQVVERLKPLAVEGNSWFGPAGEMTALAYVKMGREDLAGALFGALSKDKTLPESLRQRTRQLAGVYGVDAVQDDESPAGAAAPNASAANEGTDS